MAIGRTTADIGANDFTHPTYRAVWELVDGGGRPAAGSRGPGLGHQPARRGHRPGRCPRRSASSASSRCSPRRSPTRRTSALHVFRLLELTATAPDRRGEVAAPAHQPGGAGRPSTTRCSASSPPSSSTAARCATGSRAPSEAGPRRPELDARPAGERLLAWTDDRPTGAVIGGTRDALYLPERLPWEQVEAADWDRDTSTFRVRRGRLLGPAPPGAHVHDRRARSAAPAGPRAGHSERRAAAARRRSAGAAGCG